ncbi:19822_t:CDS:2, partial [Racocetra persica]
SPFIPSIYITITTDTTDNTYVDKDGLYGGCVTTTYTYQSCYYFLNDEFFDLSYWQPHVVIHQQSQHLNIISSAQTNQSMHRENELHYYPVVDNYMFKAKALYDYLGSMNHNELSFTKGEILYITSNQGKWWNATKINGTTGVVP